MSVLNTGSGSRRDFLSAIFGAVVLALTASGDLRTLTVAPAMAQDADIAAALRELQRGIDDAKARGAAADARIQETAKINRCLDRLEREKPNQIRHLNNDGSNCFSLLGQSVR